MCAHKVAVVDPKIEPKRFLAEDSNNRCLKKKNKECKKPAEESDDKQGGGKFFQLIARLLFACPVQFAAFLSSLSTRPLSRRAGALSYCNFYVCGVVGRGRLVVRGRHKVGATSTRKPTTKPILKVNSLEKRMGKRRN